MSAQRLDAALDTTAPLQLVRAAAALRWKRPDLTVTLAELALDAADDAATWVTAAGWLLHGRTLLGDGRQIACDLLDGLGRWGDAGAELMTGPHGRRLRIELAGPARRTGEQAVARALLAADAGVDAVDGELRADVLAELARCAVDEAPDTADAALDAAEQGWLAAGCEPGVASVLLVRAALHRRAGRADASVAAAVAGLARVNASGRRAGGTESDHLAAALTAEWIAALVDAGRLDEARSDALPAANRLLTATRPGRQLAGLRLAVARVAAVSESADTVLAALEPAAQDAADGDVPELESACRSMLGELHETAGRLDAALTAVRAAMAAERCDRDRGARLRTRLAAVMATWAGRPSGHGVARHPEFGALPDATLRPAGDGLDVVWADGSAADVAGRGTGAGEPGHVDPVSDPPSTPGDRTARARARAGNWSGATGAGRWARRLAAEAAAEQGWSDPPLPELGTPVTGRPHSDPHPAAPADEAQPGPESDDSWFDHATATLHAAGTGGVSGDGARGKSQTAADGAAAAGTPTGAPTRTTDTGRAVAIGATSGSTSLIGDALLRELIGNGSSPNGLSGLDRHRDEPAAARRTDAGVADTVVFALDRRHDSTVAVPPVPPTNGTSHDDAAGRHRPAGRGPDTGSGLPQADAPAGPAANGQPLPRRAPGGPQASVPKAAARTGAHPGPEPDGRGGPADTVRVGRPVERGQCARDHDDTAPPGTNGSRDPGHASARGRVEGHTTSTGPGAPGGAANPPPAGPRRPSTADTDGLGIGDLLAGALAAYRGI